MMIRNFIFLISFMIIQKCFTMVIHSTEIFSEKCLEEFRKVSLDKHNEFRKKHNAPTLLRDSAIEVTAQNHANELAKTNEFVYSENRGNIGENLFAQDLDEELTLEHCKTLAEECVNSWYEESSLFNFDKPEFNEKTAHFTQLIWKGSTKLGMGFSIGQIEDYNSFYCVAHYSPSGNVIGRFKKNVNRIGNASKVNDAKESDLSDRKSEENKLSNSCLDEFRKASLDKHNELRKKHNALSLLHDNNLDITAQDYANVLANTNNFVHSENRGNIGENLYAKFSTEDLTPEDCKSFGNECVEGWYSEMSMYDYEKPGFDLKTGHFTQLIWSGSKKLGMGFSMGKLDEYNSFYCVAHYSPSGNVFGRFKQNVNKIIRTSETNRQNETSISTIHLPKEEGEYEDDKNEKGKSSTTQFIENTTKEASTKRQNKIEVTTSNIKVNEDKTEASTLPQEDYGVEYDVTTTLSKETTRSLEITKETTTNNQSNKKLTTDVANQSDQDFELAEISECLIKLNKFFFQKFSQTLLTSVNFTSQNVDTKRFKKIIDFFSQKFV